MAREVDEKKKRKAQRILRRVADRAKDAPRPLTDWEKEFVDGVTERLETYGSAFRDPGKGRMEDALSVRQTHIVRQLDRKVRKPASGAKESEPGEPDRPGKLPSDKPRSGGLKRKTPMRASKSLRDRERPAEPEPEPETPPRPDPVRPSGPPVLRVLPGGKS